MAYCYLAHGSLDHLSNSLVGCIEFQEGANVGERLGTRFEDNRDVDATLHTGSMYLLNDKRMRTAHSSVNRYATT